MPTQQQGATKISFQTLWHVLMPGNLTEVKECDWDVQSKILNSTSSSGGGSFWYVCAGKENYDCYMGRPTLIEKSSSMNDKNNLDPKVQCISVASHHTKNSPKNPAHVFCFLAHPKRPNHQFLLAIFCPCLLMPAQPATALPHFAVMLVLRGEYLGM